MAKPSIALARIASYWLFLCSTKLPSRRISFEIRAPSQASVPKTAAWLVKSHRSTHVTCGTVSVEVNWPKAAVPAEVRATSIAGRTAVRQATNMMPKQ